MTKKDVSSSYAARASFVLGLVISLAFLVYFFSGIDWQALLDALKDANYLLVGMAVALFLASYPIRAYRWKFLLPRAFRCYFITRLSATTIGFMATSVFPGRAGELVRASVLALKGRVPFGTAFASIIVERLYDLLIVLLALVLVLFELPASLPEEGAGIGWVRTAGASFGAFATALILGLLILRSFPHQVVRFIKLCIKPAPDRWRNGIFNFVQSIIDGLIALESFGMILWVFVLSIIHWSIVIVGIDLILRSFGMSLQILASLLVFAFVSLGVALPQAPSFIGVYQVVAEAALKIMDAPLYAAKGFALLSWAASIVPISLVGFGFLYWEGLTMRSVMEHPSADPG